MKISLIRINVVNLSDVSSRIKNEILTKSYLEINTENYILPILKIEVISLLISTKRTINNGPGLLLLAEDMTNKRDKK